MNYEERKALFDAVVENEFNHISSFEELEDIKKNKEVIKYDNEISDIEENLFKNISHECGMLLDKLHSAETGYWTLIARYYFRKGVSAGLTNLNFLNKVTRGTKFY